MVEKFKVNKKIFSERLKQLMEEQKETTYTLGELLHLSAATISRYTTGEMSPKITTIQVLANHYNINPVWLMGHDVPKYLEVEHKDTELELIAFGKRLKSIREESGYTKKEVANILNIDTSTYGKYELGKCEPDYSILTKIAEIFNVSTDYLLCRTDIRQPIETIAAHHDGEDWTEEELEEIERFKEFVRMKRQQKNN
ncbi:helix-turn-helix domain-containing protein [Defluviitalea raffinosedens]|uniref:Helix-turn-helix domain-containing protein n=1 Tax=Defluviitalea raffinosedens TaxID=1450156 RepID=A0A7C8LEA8_9FIRM|nr:helix-turn-helix transcriptional regulator [Defluviitalea raffinosedens]KAE9633747.1 helix-turn-helix domain-containing protein [Defluviitalea raffinosedens]